MTTAQGIVLVSASYFQDVTAEMKALIDRAGFVGLANGKAAEPFKSSNTEDITNAQEIPLINTHARFSYSSAVKGVLIKNIKGMSFC
jgi:multimeric flavodoxin WrbA